MLIIRGCVHPRTCCTAHVCCNTIASASWNHVTCHQGKDAGDCEHDVREAFATALMERMKSNPLFTTPRGGCSESERKSQNEFSILCPPSAPRNCGRLGTQLLGNPCNSVQRPHSLATRSNALGTPPLSDNAHPHRTCPHSSEERRTLCLTSPSEHYCTHQGTRSAIFADGTQHRPFARQLQHIDEHRWQAPKPDSEGEDAGGPDSWRTILTIQGGDVLAPKDCTHDTTDQSLVATPTYNAQDAVAASA